MARTKLYFDVTDNEYFNRLKEYICVNYSMYFEISAEKPADGSTFIISDYINRRNKKGVILIKDEKGDICKYHSASDICSRILEISSPDMETDIHEAKNKPLLICVTSAVGGAGKTTVSQAMCCKFASEGHRVLYVNLNPFTAGEQPFSVTDKNSFTMLRYYLRKNDSGLSVKIKSLVSRDISRRVDYIVNKYPSPDGFLSSEEAEVLVKNLRRKPLYDAVVFDIPSYPEDGHLELMRRASCNFILRVEKQSDRQTAYRKMMENEGVGFKTAVTNFSDTGEYHIPEAKGIFNTVPGEFWNSIGVLCRLSEGKSEAAD